MPGLKLGGWREEHGEERGVQTTTHMSAAVPATATHRRAAAAARGRPEGGVPPESPHMGLRETDMGVWGYYRVVQKNQLL